MLHCTTVHAVIDFDGRPPTRPGNPGKILSWNVLEF
jgi:hypothetical protein